MLSVPTADEVVKDLVQCGYVRAADLADRYGNSKQALDPDIDPMIVGPTGIFTQAEYNADDDIRKTAAVMKMVVNGYAGAGTIEMGGFDYHTGDRATGEMRDFGAGRCMGACIEYAARRGQPLMLYVFSDGSLSSNGMIDNSAGGRGKGVWTGDNQSTAAAFFLVYNPKGTDQRDPKPDRLLHRRRLGGECRQPGRERREPARRDGGPQLPGITRQGRDLPEHAMGHGRAHRPGESGYLQQPHRHATDRLGALGTGLTTTRHSA